MVVVASVIGWMASAFSAVSFLPQVAKVFREKSTAGLSLSSFAMVFVASTCWVTYGYLIADWPLMVTNGVMIASTGSVVVAKLLLYPSK